MKKPLWTGLVLLLLIAAGAAWFFWLRQTPRYRAEEILPANTLALIDLPDARASRERFRGTAISRILAEPEVRRCLEKPAAALREAIQRDPATVPILRELLKLCGTAEGEVFIALTDISISPNWNAEVLVGFDPGAQRQEAEAAFEALLARCRLENPTTEVEEAHCGNVTYHVWSPRKQIRIAFGRIGNLHLLSFGEQPLRQAIERAADRGKDRLAATPLFISHRAATTNSDAFFLLNPKAAFANLQPLFAVQPMVKKQLEAVLPIESVLGTFAIKDQGIEGHSWTRVQPALQAGLADFKKCERLSLSAAGPDTLLYAACGVDIPRWCDRFMETLDKREAHPATGAIREAINGLELQGISLRDGILKHLASEAALIIEWHETAAAPSVNLLLETGQAAVVRDTMRELFQQIQNRAAPGAMRIESGTGPGQAPILTLALANQDEWLSPTFATWDRFAILSLNRRGAEGLLNSMQGSRARLSAVAEFQKADARFGKDYYQFVYCDPKRLVEGLYALAGKLGANLPPNFDKVRETFDPAMMPKAGTLSQHLFPAVWVAGLDTNGLHQASFGPINLATLTLGIAGTTVTHALAVPPPSTK